MTKHNNRLKIAPTLMAKCVFTVLTVKHDSDMTWEQLSQKQRFTIIDSVLVDKLNMVQALGPLGELSQVEISFISDKIVALLRREPFDGQQCLDANFLLAEAIEHTQYYIKQEELYEPPTEALEKSKHEKLKAWYAGASPAERNELLDQLTPSDMNDEELQQYYDDILAQYDNPANHEKILLIQQALNDNPID